MATTTLFTSAKFKISTGDRGSTKEIETYEMDMKTMIWFVSKFNHELRLRIVNYAFDKLEQEHND